MTAYLLDTGLLLRHLTLVTLNRGDFQPVAGLSLYAMEEQEQV